MCQCFKMKTVVVPIVTLILIVSCRETKACGWNTTELSGTVQSPNFPGNYSNNLECTYIITAPKGYQVTLTFTDFDTEADLLCRFDYLEIREGDATSPVIDKRLCGATVPSPVRTSGNQMWIKFVSDDSHTRGGFKSTFTSANLQASFFLITTSMPPPDVGGSVYRMDMETKSDHTLFTTVFAPKAVDYDPVQQTVYWTEVGQLKGIRGAFLNGSGMHTVLDTGSGSLLDGLAVDHQSRLIFYTDTGRNLIAMVTMVSFAHKTIINTSVDEPRAIVLDTTKGVMFWTDLGAPRKIERSNYDGTDRRTLVSTGLFHVNALALDVSNSRLYWVDSNTFSDKVEMSDMEGNGRRTVTTFKGIVYHLLGMALLDNYLYVTDSYPTQVKEKSRSNTSYVHRVDINTGSATVFARVSSIRLNDIHVYDPRLYSVISVNGCGKDNGGCATFCIPLPSNRSKCMCPDGQTLASDQRSCVEEKPTRFRLNVAAIGGGIGGGGGAVVAVIVIVHVCWCKRRRRKPLGPPVRNTDEFGGVSVENPVEQPRRREHQPRINTEFDQEGADNERNSTYDTLDSLAEAVHVCPVDGGYLTPAPNSNTQVCPVDRGYLTPTTNSNTQVDPADVGCLTPTPNSNTQVNPADVGCLTPTPNSNTQVCPPDGGYLTPTPNNNTQVCPADGGYLTPTSNSNTQPE